MQTLLYSGGSGGTNAPIANLGDDRARIFLPRLWTKDASKRAVLIGFGTGDGFAGAYAPSVVSFAADLTAQNYAVAVSIYGGSLFGNPTAQSRMAALRTFMVGTIGAKPKVALVGFSMNGGGLAAFAGNNPSLVSSFFGVCPLTDLGQYAGNATLDAAYSGGWSEATYGATTNPKTMATAGKYTGLDVRVGYTVGDAVISQSSVEAFGTQVGRAAINLGNAPHSYDNFGLPGTRNSVLAQLIATDGV